MIYDTNIGDLLLALSGETVGDVKLSSKMNENMIPEPNATTSTGPHTPGSSPEYIETRLSEEMVGGMSGWLDDSSLQSIKNNLIVTQLDEILLLLITIRGEAVGKELRQDLNRMFGADLSPGTVYPHLSDLADEGLLNATELAKRKVYSTAEAEEVRDDVSTEIDELLTFSIMLKLMLLECTPKWTLSRGEER